MPNRSFLLAIFLLAALHSGTHAGEPATAYSPTYSAPVVTERCENAKLTQRTWPVADLLCPIIEAGKAAPIADPVGRAKASLRKLIIEAIASRSWSGNGGRATIEFNNEGNELVVRQTAESLEQVEDLLYALRRLEKDMDTPELFECFYHELWEAHHDQPSWLGHVLSVLVPIPLIRHLPVMEPPYFWAAIANNPQVPIAYRRQCALQLFRRHVRPGMKLSELAAILEHPSWLRRNHVTDWKHDVAGSFFIEVGITTEDSTFGVGLFPEYGDAKPVLLRVSGQMPKEEFVKILREGNDGTNASILELSFCPP